VVAYDVFLADCPARTTLDLVADTWSVIAIVALGRGTTHPADPSFPDHHV
jgi:DNA-binding HxlR family transcriptional regulator